MDNPDQKEARLYFVINDFEDLINEYGVNYIMEKLRFPIYTRLYEYFDNLE